MISIDLIPSFFSMSKKLGKYLVKASIVLKDLKYFLGFSINMASSNAFSFIVDFVISNILSFLLNFKMTSIGKNCFFTIF